MTRETALIRRVLHRARTVAVIGASPRPERHSHAVASYLSREGYDVIPVRPDRQQVAGLPTYATLADVAGPVDLVVVVRRPAAVPAHIEEAAARRPAALWLQPGTWTREAAAVARAQGLTLIKERCIVEAHRHLSQPSGHPARWACTCAAGSRRTRIRRLAVNRPSAAEAAWAREALERASAPFGSQVDMAADGTLTLGGW